MSTKIEWCDEVWNVVTGGQANKARKRERNIRYLTKSN